MSEHILIDVLAHRTCPRCGNRATVKVYRDEYEAWRGGFGHIQTLMPNTTAGDRETLISGYHEECWDIEFGDEDD